MKTLFISDLHLDHKNIIKFEQRPFKNLDEMNEKIIEGWNKKVDEEDIVLIGGDFAFCDGKRANYFLSRLKGKKGLVVGNHDKYLRDKEFDKNNFIYIKDRQTVIDKFRKVIVSHYPEVVWDCQHHGAIHLYGHIHRFGFERHQLVLKLENAYNISSDVLGHVPMTLDEVIAINNKIQNEYREKLGIK